MRKFVWKLLFGLRLVFCGIRKSLKFLLKDKYNCV